MPSDSVPRMDTSGSGSEGSGTDGVLSSSPGTSSVRERTDSEGSDRQTRFVLPSADGSPPKVLTLNEVVDVVKNIQNMTLAHEIVLNPEFKLQPYEPPENSLEKRIKEVMHKAFWDVLREQLNRDPPCFDHAIQLLNDIKECFPQIIPSHNLRALEEINEILDIKVIRQQAEEGVLDFQSYVNFVLQIMKDSCAPIRDEQIKKLSEEKDVVETFKGILETMALMKLDMANFLLEYARNDLVANSVEYEKKRFREYLEYYKFGFPATENWLKKNQTRDINGKVSTPDQTIYNAYMELLEWDDANEFPEILAMDKERINKLGHRALRLCACVSVVAICTGIPIFSQRAETLKLLAKQILILLENVTNNKELEEVIENVWVHVKSVLTTRLEEEKQSGLDSNVENAMKTQILQIAKKESPVRNLMWKRLSTYFRLVSCSKGGLPPPPPGYIEVKEELESFATAFKRLITYNYSVFGEYYVEILTNSNSKVSNENGSTTKTAAAN